MRALINSIVTAPAGALLRRKTGYSDIVLAAAAVTIIGVMILPLPLVVIDALVALNIAIGSSMQIALFVAPVLVFISYLFSVPMNLIFTPLEVVAVVVSVMVVALIAQDGESNWMEGVLLLAVYTILGLTFYFLPV